MTENFDDVTTLAGAGWVIVNESTPVGVSDWFQGTGGIFPAQAGAPAAYIAANFNSSDSAGGSTISTWLISPMLSFQNGDMISFFSRTQLNPADFPDRLELRFSTAGASSATADFLTLLLSINPTLSSTGYPSDWTQYTATISGLGGATDGRFAFRYHVTDGDVNGNYIGVDTVSVTDGSAPEIPEPSTYVMAVLGLGALAWARRR